MASLSIPEAAARVNDVSLNFVSVPRMLREAQRGAFPTHTVGARLRIDARDIPYIVEHFGRIDSARAIAARIAFERALRKAERASARLAAAGG